jgi:hypothetical protein
MFPPLYDKNLMIKKLLRFNSYRRVPQEQQNQKPQDTDKKSTPSFLNMNFVKKLSTSVDLQP